MIGHKLSNKTKSATVAEPKPFHQLNNEPHTSLHWKLVRWLKLLSGATPQYVRWCALAPGEQNNNYY
jgi:hypothetical protein